MYPDQSWKEMCGMMAHLVADSGAGKGQLSGLVEAIWPNEQKLHTRHMTVGKAARRTKAR